MSVMDSLSETPANVLGAQIRERLDDLASAAFYSDPHDEIVKEIMARVDELIGRVPRSILSMLESRV